MFWLRTLRRHIDLENRMKIKSIGEPKIVKLHVDLEDKIKQGEQISLQVMGGVMIPQNEDDDECFASMNLLMKNNVDKVMFSLMIQSKVVCPALENDKKSREILIKDAAFPKLIDKLKEIYNQLEENTIIKLPDLPDLNLS